MKLTTITYKNGDVDISKSMTETIRSMATGTAFSSDEIAEALHAAHTQDEGCSDLHFLKSQTKRWIGNILANPMTPDLSLHLCTEQDGKFVRK